MPRRNSMLRRCLTIFARRILVCGFGAIAIAANALTAPQALALAKGENEERIVALNASLARGDDGLAAFVQAMLDDEVRLAGDKVLVVRGDKAVDAATGAEVKLPEDAEEVINSNQMRRELEGVQASLKLFSKDVAERRVAVKALREAADESRLAVLEQALAAETDNTLKEQLGQVRGAILIASADPAKRREAVKALANSLTPATRALLMQRLKPAADGGETEAEIRTELEVGLRAVNSRLAMGEWVGMLFTGISLGSILLLAALGLAVTYGLMGVINMAHGELMMIGAYATYLVQNAFKAFLPGAFDIYILAAIPASFLTAAAVGAALERSVIRWLYGRPLETLLATWGISLILQQGVRTIFGAQNVTVENPAWLSGGLELMSNLTLPFNRIAIIAFAVLVLMAVALLIARTRLGLFVRGVTQNRKMAACMGVNTARIDTYAFALGSGIAGLAGCALSQVGNVGPDLGQGYIVDSFMVVVLGGVGQLAGTVYAALGLGILNKLLEGWQGAVLAKIMVLVFIVVFIQKRPQGIFAMKGRSAEA